MQRTRVAEYHGALPNSSASSLWDVFVKTPKSYPHRDAVVSLWQTDANSMRRLEDQQDAQEPSTNVRWCYNHLLQEAEILASSLETRGFVSGMPLVVLLGNSAEWALFFWAAAKLQTPFVPLDPRALADSDGMQKMLGLIKPGVIVVSDTKAAEALAGSSAVMEAHVRVQISRSEQTLKGWTSFSDLSTPCRSNLTTIAVPDTSKELDDIALVIFTSGTTSTPKGCLHTAANLLSQISDYDPQGDVIDRWLVHTPVSHIFAVNHALRAWSRGDAIVFPSEYFDAQATLRALMTEQCTFMAAVPTMLKALLAHPSFPGRDALNLTFLTMGGTTITDADIRLCKDRFGAKDAVQAFGMSEGAPIASWVRQDALLKDGYHPGVGKALPGAHIRVCAPESNIPLAVNDVGELHIGGPSVIRGYLGGAASDRFYDDAVGHWHITGDQATIDQDGVLHLLGRYKDLIIRAGENIAPLQIENALAKIEGVTAQVIGVPDEIAGEVPIAVVSLPTKAQVAERASDMGLRYTLDSVYTLEELGLKGFPMTKTGKIRKDELKKAVLLQKDQQSLESTARDALVIIQQTPLKSPPSRPGLYKEDGVKGAPPNLVEELSSLVSDLLGSSTTPETDLQTLMDSVTMLRYSDRVLRKLGRKLYLHDMLKFPTLKEHAAMMQSREMYQHIGLQDPASGEPMGSLTGKPPPLSKDMYSMSPGRIETSDVGAPEMRKDASEILTQLRIDAVDIEEVYPVRANYHRFVSGQRPQTYRHRMSFSVRGATTARVRQAFEMALSSRPILRTVLVRSSQNGVHLVAIRPPAILDHILECVEVPDDKHLKDMTEDDCATAFHTHLSTQAKIVTVRESSTIHLVVTYSHAVFDLLSIEPFHRDIDHLLSAHDMRIAATVSTTPFKLLANLYHDYSDSVPARSSVQASAHRLRGISKFGQSALWPRQRAPGWMIGSDAGLADPEVRVQRATVREALWAQSGSRPWDESTAREFRYPRTARVLKLGDMKRLRAEKGLHPQTVAVAALAVFNCLQTGQPYAIFNTIDAGRAWPFVPAWLQSMMPSPMSVDGPMIEVVLNMLRVDLLQNTSWSTRSGKFVERGSIQVGAPPETTGGFLARIRREQELVANNAHAPWDKVLEALGPDEGRVAVDAVSRQTFVWDVSLKMVRGQTDYTSLRPEARHDWPDCGIYWNCCMIDQESFLLVASWDTAQMSDQEVHRYCDQYSDVLRKLCSLRSWDRQLSDVFMGSET